MDVPRWISMSAGKFSKPSKTTISLEPLWLERYRGEWFLVWSKSWFLIFLQCSCIIGSATSAAASVRCFRSSGRHWTPNQGTTAQPIAISAQFYRSCCDWGTNSWDWSVLRGSQSLRFDFRKVRDTSTAWAHLYFLSLRFYSCLYRDWGT